MGDSRTRSRRSLLHPDRVDLAAADVEDDARQGPPRRTRGWRAGPEIEAALVTRAVKASFARPGDDGTRQVRALLAERHEFARRQSDQQARFVFGRIGEHHGASHREVVYGGNALDQRLATPRAPPVLHADPQLP